MKLRLLSMWQPYAELLVSPRVDQAYPIKPFETRHWRPLSPDPIRTVIHATKKHDREIKDAIDEFDDLLDMRMTPRPLSFGKVIGLVTFIAFVPTDDLAMARVPLSELEGDAHTARRTGNFEPGRFAWQAIKARPLPEPIEHMGRQGGLMEVPDAVRAEIAAQLGPGALEL